METLTDIAGCQTDRQIQDTRTHIDGATDQ